MSHPQHDVIIRSIAGAGELELFCALDYILNDELADDLATGRRRPEWMWVALRGEHLVARAAWWGSGDDAGPSVLDILDVAEVPGRIDVGVRLLQDALSEIIPAGTRPPEYGRYIPPDWREHAGPRRAVEDRMAIAGQLGAQLLTERLRFEWRPGTPVAAPTGRLEFRPVRDDGELLELMTLTMDGTLDAHSQQDLALMPARQGAVKHFEEELARFSSPRQWWRIATLPGGEPAGFVIPARNNYHAIIAYLGVVPAQRGHGWASKILAEGTRILAAQDAPRIRASTDLGNIPMAEAFTRAGWVNFERSISMTWP
jgi:RimJ/RimL family protein N-acetyltransferase